MTYPDNPQGLMNVGMQKPGLQSVGIFTEDSPQADAARTRLAAIGTEWFTRCQSQRIKQERQWYLNLAFYYGNQYVQFRNTSPNGPFDLYVPKAPSWRVRMTVNQIRKIVRKDISRLTSQKPNAFVVPASTEDADVFAAQAGEQIWDSLWRRLKFPKTLRDTVFWQTVCGNGFTKSYWDPQKQDPDSDMSGDICIENVSPFYIFVPDLLAVDIENQPYVIHAQVRNMQWVRQYLGVEPTGDVNLNQVDDAMTAIMGVTKNDSKKEQTVVLEVWVKPGNLPELPNGGVFTIAANKIVQGFDTWPYDHGQYPFSKFDSMPTGKFYSASIVEDLIPLQKELNRTRNQLIEAKNRMAKPQLIAMKGSVDPKAITTEPGQVIEYSPGLDPPQPLPMQNLPSYVTEEINRLYTDLSDISGQHEVSNGSTPPGVTAATAISFLQEQDESLIAGHYTSIEEGIEKIGSQSLYYVKMYWDEPRTVKIAGMDSTFDVQVFKGSDLRSNCDLRVESGSALPTSRAAKQAFIMDLMKMQFIPPQDGLELMEVGGLNRLYERIQIDKRQAQRENLKMRVVTQQDVEAHQQEWMQQNPEVQKDIQTGLQLEAPPIVSVNTYDNHQLHIEVHNNFRKSQSFENVDPIVKITFEEHVRQHIEALTVGMDRPPPPIPGEGDPNAGDPNAQQPGMPGPDTMPELSDEGSLPQ